ncbi:hydroxyacid dehydrogenase [Rathayibacter sp. CAU 1779]
MSGIRPQAIGLISDRLRRRLFAPEAYDRLNAAVEVVSVGDSRPPTMPIDRLERVELAITGWASPAIDERMLDLLPSLRAVIHTAGSLRGFATEAAWDRGVQFSSAADVNAIPVAEFVVAMILLVGKQVLPLRERYRQVRGQMYVHDLGDDVGNFRRTVGVVGASMVGRRVIDLLGKHDVEILLHDPYLGPSDAEALGVRLVGLADLFAGSDVVTLHQPLLPSTRGGIDGRMLALLRDGGTLVNTARGGVVDAAALERELVSGRLNAVLDTTEPEILPADSVLYDLPNVVLTPHIAGSLGNEVRRLGEAAVRDAEHFARFGELRHPVPRAAMAFRA